MVSFIVGGREAERMGRGVVGDVEVVHTFSRTGGGLHSAAFTLSMPASGFHAELHAGARVIVREGAVVLGHGHVADDYDPRTGQVRVNGDYVLAKNFNAVDGGGAPTTSPSVAVQEAIARGLPWNGTGNLPADPLAISSEDASRVNTVDSLLNRYCELNGTYWMLDADNVPRIVAEPTNPTLILRPGVRPLRTVAGDYITTFVVRYVTQEAAVDSGQPVPTGWGTVTATMTPPTGVQPKEDYEDISSLGILAPDPGDAADIAQGYADAVLAARGPRMWFAEACEVRHWQLATTGGVSPALWRPCHGQRVTHYGALTDAIGAPIHGQTLTWVVGKTTYRPADRTRILEPVDITPRATLPKIIGWKDSPHNPVNRDKNQFV